MSTSIQLPPYCPVATRSSDVTLGLETATLASAVLTALLPSRQQLRSNEECMKTAHQRIIDAEIEMHGERDHEMISGGAPLLTTTTMVTFPTTSDLSERSCRGRYNYSAFCSTYST